MIKLNPCRKAYIGETHRAKTPEETRKWVEAKALVLGLKNVRNSTDVDRLGIPVFTCQRTRFDGFVVDHGGKGLTKDQAIVSMLMEAIERYSAELRESDREKLVKTSFNELRKTENVVDPWDLVLDRFSEFHRDADIYWVKGWDISRQEEVYVPAVAVYHPFRLDDYYLFASSTNGLASGNTLEEAVFHALMEVIERDAWSIAEFTTRTGDLIEIDEVEDYSEIRWLMQRFEEAQVVAILRDITTDIGVPVVACASQDPLLKETPLLVKGFGAHLDEKVAAYRALAEVALTRVMHILKFQLHDQRYRDMREKLWRHFGIPSDYLFSMTSELEAAWFDQEFSEAKTLSSMRVGYSDDILQDVEEVVRRLKARGFERVIVFDLTREELGVPTVRVVVPGLEVYGFDRKRAGERLLKAL